MQEQEAIKIIESELAFEPIDRDKEALKVAVKALKEIRQYRAIGTVQQCREAVEKQKAKKPISKSKHFYYENCSIVLCPACNGRLKLKSKGAYCDKCGQRLDWG